MALSTAAPPELAEFYYGRPTPDPYWTPTVAYPDITVGVDHFLITDVPRDIGGPGITASAMMLVWTRFQSPDYLAQPVCWMRHQWYNPAGVLVQTNEFNDGYCYDWLRLYSWLNNYQGKVDMGGYYTCRVTSSVSSPAEFTFYVDVPELALSIGTAPVLMQPTHRLEPFYYDVDPFRISYAVTRYGGPLRDINLRFLANLILVQAAPGWPDIAIFNVGRGFSAALASSMRTDAAGTTKSFDPASAMSLPGPGIYSVHTSASWLSGTDPNRESDWTLLWDGPIGGTILVGDPFVGPSPVLLVLFISATWV